MIEKMRQTIDKKLHERDKRRYARAIADEGGKRLQ